MKVRGFEVVEREHLKVPDVLTGLPYRSDLYSAGYDFRSKETITIQPYESHLFWTDVKAYMQDDEVLKLYIRSSLGIQGLRLMNQVGIIDCSYYSNPKNDGNIGICIQNHTGMPFTISVGDRIAQGIFQKYLLADSDEVVIGTRNGGFGSTGR